MSNYFEIPVGDPQEAKSKSEADWSGCDCGVCERLYECEDCHGSFESDNEKSRCERCEEQV